MDKLLVTISLTLSQDLKYTSNFNVPPCIFNSIIDKHQHMHFTFNNILV